MTYSKQQVDDNTDYKPGHAISLEDRMISVKYDNTLCLDKEGRLSVIPAGGGGDGDYYLAGKAIDITDDVINVKVNNQSIIVNDNNELEVIGVDGKIYKAGNGLGLSMDTFNVRTDDTSIKINNRNQLETLNKGVVSGDAIECVYQVSDGKYRVGAKYDNSTIRLDKDGNLSAVQQTIPTYSAGSGLTLNKESNDKYKFDVNVDGSSIQINNNNQLEAIDKSIKYSAGDGISIDNNTIKTKIDGTTIKVDSNGVLNAATYTAGDGLSLSNNKFSAAVDGTTIKINDKHQLESINTAPTYTAGDGLSLSNNKFSAAVDGTTIKINDKHQLESIGGGSTYTAGDGININDSKISINQDWFDVKDSVHNPTGTLQFQNVNGTTKLCVVDVKYGNIKDDGYFTQTLGLNPDYDMNFNTSIQQDSVDIPNNTVGDDGAVLCDDVIATNNTKYLLSITDIPDDINMDKDEAQFLRIHLPSYIVNEHGKPIETITCNVKHSHGDYTCDISYVQRNSKNENELFNDSNIPDDLITFTNIGCDIDFKHFINATYPGFLLPDNELRICDKDGDAIIAGIYETNGSFAFHGTKLPPDDGTLDMVNAIFHFQYEHHKDLFKDGIIIQLWMQPEDFAYRTYSLTNFKLQPGKVSYTIPCINKVDAPDPGPTPEPGHYNASDYPMTFKRTDIGWDIYFADILNVFGNDVPSQYRSTCRTYMLVVGDKATIPISYDGCFDFDGRKFTWDDFDTTNHVFHYNYDKYHQYFDDDPTFQLVYGSLIDAKRITFNIKFDINNNDIVLNHIRSEYKNNRSNSSYYTIDYLDDYDKPGLMSCQSINPYALLLRGDIMIDVIYDKTNIDTDNVIKCKELIADNCFTLHRSPLIFLYEPDDFGSEIIDGVDYWYIDFGYSHDSDAFNALPNNQPFEFIDNKIFGLHYTLTKNADTSLWTGNNVYYHLKDNYSTIDHYDSDAQYISIIVSNNDQLAFVLNKKWGNDSEWSNPHKFLYNHMTFEMITSTTTFDMSKFIITEHDDSLTSFNYNGDNCSLVKFKLKFNGSAAEATHASGTLRIKFTSPIDGSTLSFDIGATTVVEDTWMIHAYNDIYINSIKLSMYERITARTYDNNKLRIYLRHNYFYQIPDGDVKYEPGTNPFSYLFSQQSYDIVPKPEACSYLETSHNIRTDGIVIGSNIETHSFLLNDLGNNVTIMNSRLDDVEEKEEQDRKDIDNLNAIIKKESKMGWKDWLGITLDVCNLIGMGFTAYSFFKLKCFGGVEGRPADGVPLLNGLPPAGEVDPRSLLTINEDVASINESLESLSDVSVQTGGMAGSVIPAIRVYDSESYAESCSVIEDMFTSLIGPDDNLLKYDPDLQNRNVSTNVDDYTHTQLYSLTKPFKFDNLAIFRGVMRIADFMKIGRIIMGDDGKQRVDAFISISPQTVFRFYDDDGNDILIKGFTTTDESTWDANHVVLGSVLKNKLSEIPSLDNYSTTTQCDDKYVAQSKIVNKLLSTIQPIDIDTSNETYHVITNINDVIDKLFNNGFRINDTTEYAGKYTFSHRSIMIGEYTFKNNENDKTIHIFTKDAMRNSIEIKQGQITNDQYQSVLVENITYSYYNNLTNEHIASIEYLYNNFPDKNKFNETVLSCVKLSDLDNYAKLSDLENYQLKSNTTITHYCPIETSINSINDFIIGAPVYITGHVYKYINNNQIPDLSNFVRWTPSTEADTTDCICSVKTTGTWNEYIGICTNIDDKNNCITFASGGDYLVRVNDTSCYSIGDEVFIDNEDNKLKVLSGETAITAKLRRMTVGIITSKINEHMLSVFKS